jgi:6-pyruvoyltetrahydropterin/6-carboxytetrahydropterin synthase
MHYLTVRVGFCAANRLRNPALSDDENRALFGVCAETHGHNYSLEVTLRGQPDPDSGMVYDILDLMTILQEEIVAKVDHRDLTGVEMLAGAITTTEGILERFHEVLSARLPEGMIHELRLGESDNSWAAYRLD